MMRRMAAAALALWTAAALAQVVGGRPQLVSSAPVEPLTLQPGRSAAVQFLFRVNPGMHINSNTPGSALLVPTRLDLPLPAGLKWAKLAYPPGHEFTVQYSDEKLSVYSGDFEVDGTLAAARQVKPGTYQVAGMLHYQACNDRQCFPPNKLPVALRVVVK